jgi:AbiV family abortive infection protein
MSSADPDETWFAEEQAILDNARRLVADARLLSDHDRQGSAFALALIALEEIGKITLRRWESIKPIIAKRKTQHLRKQCAVGSLLIAAQMSAPLNDPDRSQDALRRLVATAVTAGLTSAESDWMISAEQGLVDKKKQFALYKDEQIPATLQGQSFQPDDVEKIIGYCRAALDVVDDHLVMNVARGIYERRPTKKPSAL